MTFQGRDDLAGVTSNDIDNERKNEAEDGDRESGSKH